MPNPALPDNALPDNTLSPSQPPWWTEEDERIAETYLNWWNALDIESIPADDRDGWNCRRCFHWESADGVTGECHAGMENSEFANCPVAPFATGPEESCEMFHPNGVRRFTRCSGAENPDVARWLTEEQRTGYVTYDWRPR